MISQSLLSQDKLNTSSDEATKIKYKCSWFSFIKKIFPAYLSMPLQGHTAIKTNKMNNIKAFWIFDTNGLTDADQS